MNLLLDPEFLTRLVFCLVPGLALLATYLFSRQSEQENHRLF